VLLRHSELPPGTRAAAANVDLSGVNLEGGTISVLDAAALTDPEFGLDEVERTRRDGNGYGDRGLEAVTHGDGDHRVLVDDKLAAMVVALAF
jgi:hypothetical protein